MCAPDWTPAFIVQAPDIAAVWAQLPGIYLLGPAQCWTVTETGPIVALSELTEHARRRITAKPGRDAT